MKFTGSIILDLLTGGASTQRFLGATGDFAGSSSRIERLTGLTSPPGGLRVKLLRLAPLPVAGGRALLTQVQLLPAPSGTTSTAFRPGCFHVSTRVPGSRLSGVSGDSLPFMSEPKGKTLMEVFDDEVDAMPVKEEKFLEIVCEELDITEAEPCSQCGKLFAVDGADLCKECRKHPVPHSGCGGFNRHCNDTKKK